MRMSTTTTTTTAWRETVLLIHWKTQWRDSYGPVVVEKTRESSHWRGVRREILDKVSAGQALSLHEESVLLADLATEEAKSVENALRAGYPVREVAHLVETPAGLRALCGGGRIEWTGGLSRIMTESGLKGRGWDIFYHSGYWQSRDNGEKVFRGFRSGSGWVDEIVIPADKAVAVLTPGDGQNLSLLVEYPKV
jgi:hypothetical protein